MNERFISTNNRLTYLNRNYSIEAKFFQILHPGLKHHLTFNFKTKTFFKCLFTVKLKFIFLS